MDTSTNNDKSISYHILPVSSNLLGLCFVILSFINVSHLKASTVIDDLLVIPILLFMTASILSYVSIRAVRRTDTYEKIADYFFLSGLGFLTITSLIIVFEVMV
ncbi:MAG: hypothetical protein IT392_01230 [Nitrospirae bacterium]|nr:hypothetical protein [Nitrospirota bacterium]